LGETVRNIYSVNLLEGASISAGTEDSAHRAANILKDDETYWRPEGTASEGCGAGGENERAELEIRLRRYTKISHIELQEQIRESQRIEAFSVYAETGNRREKIYEGTTVGFRKICRFKPVETDHLRITIEQSRIYPTLRFAGAYAEP
jgi:alpha-L-fucosidase